MLLYCYCLLLVDSKRSNTKTVFRCPAGKYWYYEGERCSELVSVPVDPLTFVLCLMASLTVVCAVIGLLVFINRRCIRKRKMVTLV